MERLLPIGIQDFAKIRKGDYKYVDKTVRIHQLISSGDSAFFLSRPRRFGKSLLCSTLGAIFEGRRELFDGLAIDLLDWEWKKHPVIRIDLNAGVYSSGVESLHSTLFRELKREAEKQDLLLDGNDCTSQFACLIEKACNKNGEKVVVIIDEYDKPLINTLDNGELHIAIRNELKGFYGVLKSCDEYLKFVFLTGITKFSQVSIFSDLNHLIDITLDPCYADICGWTQEEVENNFDSYIELIARENEAGRQEVLDAIRHWYNGFSWDGNVFVYNPFSTLLLFSKRVFNNYWFATATPTFLIDIIKERNDVKYLLDPIELDITTFNTFDYKTLDTKLLLFQTGYLTVKSVKKCGLGVPPVYTLGVPNNEVRNAMLEYLVSSYAVYPVTDTAILRDRLRKQLLDGDEAAFEKSVKELFAGIPYQLHIPREAYYHSLFLVWLNLLGFEVQGEVSTDKGRIDAVWIHEDQAVIAEVKFAKKGSTASLVQNAVKQINKKEYYERYRGNKRKVSLLGIGFNGKSVACKMVKLSKLIKKRWLY